MSTKIIIIPTYNELDNIERLIRKIFELYDNSYHILIIDDNSPDGTAKIVKNLAEEFSERLFLISRQGKLGLGTAYITGFLWAIEREYDLVFEMDADFSHNPADLAHLCEACEKEGADLAIGSRYVSGVNVINWPLGRILMSYIASSYVRLITGMKIMDTTAGFKCYRKDALNTIKLESIKFKGYAFQIEMKFAIWKLGFKITEVPIVFTERKFGTSKMSGGIFNEALWGVIFMKLNSFFRSYRQNSSLI